MTGKAPNTASNNNSTTVNAYVQGQHNSVTVHNGVQTPSSPSSENSTNEDAEDDMIHETLRDGPRFPITKKNLKALASGGDFETNRKRERELELNRSMDTEEKKRKVLQSYLTTQVELPKLDKYKMLKIKTYVRETIFKNCKFLKGDGTTSVACRRTREMIRALQRRYGMSHKTMDLVSEPDRTSYAKKILQSENIGPDTHTWYEIGMWWRLWAPVVREEIMRVRSSRGYWLKKTVQDGEFPGLDRFLILIYSVSRVLEDVLYLNFFFI